MTQPDEQVLAEGGVTRVVRLEDTVRRPVRPFTRTVQAFLRHLRAQGIEFVPEPLGYDDQGREVLRYVPGDVPLQPLSDWATTEPALAELARLIRRPTWDQVRARDYQPWDVQRDGDRTIIDGSDTEVALAAIRVQLSQPVTAEDR